jgi:hypothetical protein
MGLELDYSQEVSCCVTDHLVQEVSKLHPELFIDKNGKVKLYEVLFHLGFNIKIKDISKNVSVHDDALIRSMSDHEKCYKARVYKGVVRQAVLSVVNGDITFDKYNMHELAKAYDKYEVLQPVNLNEYVSSEDLFWVKDFGNRSKLVDQVKEEV